MQALGAEIIITFEGTSENGAQFMSRQSYLSSEIHWGYIFVDIVHHAKQGDTTHTVDIARQANYFPQAELETLYLTCTRPRCTDALRACM